MLGVLKKATVASFVFLAACAQEAQVERGLAASLAVTSVTARTSVTRDETALPKAAIVETARSKVENTLRAANPAGARSVTVEMDVTSFYIANPIAGVLLGSSQSGIVTQVRILDAETGAVVKDAFRVAGSTEARPTVLGAAAIKAPSQELQTITDDLARNVLIAVYGNIASSS